MSKSNFEVASEQFLSKYDFKAVCVDEKNRVLMETHSGDFHNIKTKRYARDAFLLQDWARLQAIYDEFLEENKVLTWGKLLKELRKLSKKQLEQTVCINDSGSETFGEELKITNNGEVYIKGF